MRVNSGIMLYSRDWLENKFLADGRSKTETTRSRENVVLYLYPGRCSCARCACVLLAEIGMESMYHGMQVARSFFYLQNNGSQS